jgi:hypothetical protein
MALEPGDLSDLQGASQQEWDTYVANGLGNAIQSSGTQHLLAAADASIAPDIAVVDWDAKPIRVESCLGDEEKAHQLLDWSTAMGDRGRLIGHEEYLEWRTIRNAAGKIVRVEMTTEVRDYWEILAKHHPVRTLNLIARFAGEPSVQPRDIYGSVNPFGAGVTPSQRGAGFRSMMFPRRGPGGEQLPPLSPYNNGQKAICFMGASVNTLAAAIALAAAAAHPYGKTEGNQQTPLTGSEAIASTPQAAVDCRNSDPTIVETLIDLAWDGQKIVLDDPAGIYITQIAHNRLLFPTRDQRVPREWFQVQRGTRGTAPNGNPIERQQRAVFEVPPGLGFVVGDLIDSDTDRTIDFGAQIAALVKVGLYVRASAAGAVNAQRRIVQVQPTAQCNAGADCQVFADAFAAMEASPPLPAPPAPQPPTRRGGGAP